MSIGSVSSPRPRQQEQLPSTTFREGSRGAGVSQLQQLLKDAGFNPGSVDGRFGPNTREAVQAFQRANGLTPDGIVGPQTRQALEGAGAQQRPQAPAAPEQAGSAPNANLATGARGSNVRDLQNSLKQLGFDPGRVDGQFGGQTREALQDFQTRWGVTSDGQYGPETRAAMNRALSGQQPPPVREPGTTRPGTGTTGPGGTTGTTGPSGPAGSPAGQRALDSARTQVGVREATGNNDGIPADRYSNGRREPWCANFVSWNFRQAGKPLPGNQRSLASVQYMEDQMKANNAWFRRGAQEPKPGDIIFFANRGGSDAGRGRHVGIVERVENGRVYTIEGNSSNGVNRRSYDLNNARISGYGRW